MIKELSRNGAALWVESALQIKRSLGIQRGRSDKVDARRTAQYASLKQATFQPFQQQRDALLRLKQLSRLKTRL